MLRRGRGEPTQAAEGLRQLLAQGTPDEVSLRAFLEGRDLPVAEGRRVLFAFEGEAEEVLLHHWIYGLDSAQAFQRIAPDLWLLVMELPEKSRVEYKIEVVQRGEQRLVSDPRNPHQARDPFGSNSVVTTPGYEHPEWAEVHGHAREGELLERRLMSSVWGGVRPLSIYLPARFRDTRRYPLLVVHDGDDYVRFAALKTILDNLIHRLEIPPLVACLTSSPRRVNEYAADENQARFVVEELIPLLEGEFPLLPGPDKRCLMGASFGGVSSLHTAWRYPGAFGKLLLQSGSFAFTDIGEHDRGPLFDPVVEWMNEFREAPGKPTSQAYLSCGVYESLISYNRSLIPVLQGAGVNVRFTEARDGHNWENWRDRLREGLTWLFPGPLWMVYE